MDFNIRAIAAAHGFPAEARADLHEWLGRRIEFHRGITLSITLPAAREDFEALRHAEQMLHAFQSWARVYRYPKDDGSRLHVIAPVEVEHDIQFCRLDIQQPRRVGKLPRPVEILGGHLLSYDECSSWLVDLAEDWHRSSALPEKTILVRPRIPKPTQPRIIWIGPDLVDAVVMARRMAAIGQVHGANVVHVRSRSYREVEKTLRGLLPFDSAIICNRYAPHVGAEVVPAEIPRELVHLCNSTSSAELEGQTRTWVEIVESAILRERAEHGHDEVMLAVMLRLMVSHGKIGQFNHCSKETVLTGIRARRMNAAAAERLVDVNSEQFHDTKDGATFFLWKGHHDGRQYFLNPRKMEEVKRLIDEVPR
jgi:hypothetical protein